MIVFFWRRHSICINRPTLWLSIPHHLITCLFPSKYQLCIHLVILALIYLYLYIMMQNTKWTIDKWLVKHQLSHASMKRFKHQTKVSMWLFMLYSSSSLCIFHPQQNLFALLQILITLSYIFSFCLSLCQYDKMKLMQ